MRLFAIATPPPKVQNFHGIYIFPRSIIQMRTNLGESEEIQMRTSNSQVERSGSEVLLDQREAYRRLGVGYVTGVSLVMSGELRSIKIGARRLVPVTALHEFVNRKLAEAGPEENTVMTVVPSAFEALPPSATPPMGGQIPTTNGAVLAPTIKEARHVRGPRAS
jgi:excisionase family DNA binding protein